MGAAVASWRPRGFGRGAYQQASAAALRQPQTPRAADSLVVLGANFKAFCSMSGAVLRRSAVPKSCWAPSRESC